jgi:hypothetical protein
MEEERTWRYHSLVAVAIAFSFIVGSVVTALLAQNMRFDGADRDASEVIVIDEPAEADILSDTVSR